MTTSSRRLGFLFRTAAPAVAEITSDRIKHLAGLGLKTPQMLMPDQVREVCASVMAHIERTPAGDKPPDAS
jgi:hypothetical protein